MRSLVAMAAGLVTLAVPVVARQQAAQGVPPDNPALSVILNAPPVITTTIPDVVNGIGLPVADEWPVVPRPMTSLRRDEAGNIELRPGVWELTVQSFSLAVGAVAPTATEGFLLAPLRGPRAEVVKQILDRASAAPEIPQEQVQAILWALLSKAKASTLPAELRDAAQRLLTPAQLSQMDAVALGRLPVSRDQLMEFLRPSEAWAIDAEARLREQVAGGAPYTALALTAIREGVFESEMGDRDILPGRWNHHPSGYFVRFTPDTYQRTKIQVIDVERGRAQVTRDATGRVARVTYPGGITFDVVYDQTQPLTLGGNAEARGYVFQRIRATRPAAAGGAPEVAELPGGWTVVGRPLGTFQLPDETGPQGAILGAYPGAASRLTDAVWMYRGVTSLESTYQEGKPTGHSDLIDAEFLRIGAREAVSASVGRTPEWAREFLTDPSPAFGLIHCVLADAACRAEAATPPRGSRVFTATGAVALSGSQQTQRLGMSLRPVR